MKATKFLIILLLPLLFSQGVKGQGYIPLVDTNKIWTTLNNMPDFQFIYWTKFSDDTIINGTRYYKVIISDTIPSPSFTPNENIVGFVREDTIFKRVYFMNAIFQEGLIYDFGANIGDTIHIHNNCFYFPGSPVCSYFEDSVIVDTIFITSVIPPYEDTFSQIINLFDNINRKVVVLKGTNNYYFDVWIEGIGSIFGIMESRSSNNNYFPGRVLLCYSEDNFLIYYNPEFNSCVFHCLNVNEYSMKFKIYPNPTTDFLIIETNQSEEPGAITMTDITGRVVYQSTFIDRIDVSHLPKGMYVLTVHTNAGQFVRKVIVH